jgi:uncharacterized phage protein gp47/JayE
MSINNLTASGFVASTVTEEVTYLNGRVQTLIDPNLDVDPDQPLGQIIGIFAAEFAAATELLATVYNSMNPAAAEGALLANLASLTGTYPQVATYSTVPCNLTLSAGTTVGAGSTISVPGQPTSNVWRLLTSVTAPSGGGVVPGSFRATVTGPQNVTSGTSMVISPTITGWSACVTTANATQGQNADTDTTLRTRRIEELGGEQFGTTAAIQAAVLAAVTPYAGGSPSGAWCYENTSYASDASGVPPHSIHVVYWAGASNITPSTTLANIIAQAIWSHKGAGVGTYGALSGVATDALGNNYTIYFDVGTAVPVYVSLNTTPNPVTTAQRAAIVTELTTFTEQTWTFGTTVKVIPLLASVLNGVAGLVDIPTYGIGLAPAPVTTGNIVMGPTQIAILSGILVNGT